MYVDALTLTALIEECTTMLVGGRIEAVIQPTEHAVALQCWAGGRTSWLLASAHPQLARLQILAHKPQKMAAEPPAFIMLLRKHLEGARLASITQPRWERIAELTFTRRANSPEGHTQVTFIIELMGRISNLILLDGQRVILGSLRQIGSEINRYRTIAPHHDYVPPPPQTRTASGATLPRLDPSTATAAELSAATAAMLAESGASGEIPAWRVLAGSVAGWSQLLSRETIFRVHGSATIPAGDADWQRISAQVRAFGRLPDSHDWHPALVSDATGRAVAFAVYDLQQYGDVPRQTFTSVNDLLDAYYRNAEWRNAVEEHKSGLRRLLQSQRERCLRKDAALRQDLAALAEAQHLRAQGELLLAHQAEIPRGTRAVTLTRFEPDSGPLTITLDPQLSAVENANRLFTRYHKLRRATEQIPTQIELNQLELARIEQMAIDLLLAENPAEIAQVRQEVAEAGYLRARREKVPAGKGSKKAQRPQRNAGNGPLRVISPDQFVLLIGKNSQQNEEVTFHLATGNDLWLHARGIPGAHVIIKSGGRPVPQRTLEEAAAFAAYYSQARDDTSVAVDYTQQRYVRHRKGGGPGMVLYERETTIFVTPRIPAESRASRAQA
jgi:predicted ribosome quality control (RQC) complex YloA/Tae2 family protein